jgi:hypothetical protein
VNAGWFGGKKKGPREDSGAFKHIGPQRALGVSAFSLALEVIPLYNFTRNRVCQYCIRAFDFILTYGPTSIFLAFSAVSLSFYVRVCAFEKARASMTPQITPTDILALHTRARAHTHTHTFIYIHYILYVHIHTRTTVFITLFCVRVHTYK